MRGLLGIRLPHAGIWYLEAFGMNMTRLLGARFSNRLLCAGLEHLVAKCMTMIVGGFVHVHDTWMLHAHTCNSAASCRPMIPGCFEHALLLGCFVHANDTRLLRACLYYSVASYVPMIPGCFAHACKNGMTMILGYFGHAHNIRLVRA